MMIAVDEFVRSKLFDDPIFSQYYKNDLWYHYSIIIFYILHYK
jgi:hypothetical protein